MKGKQFAIPSSFILPPSSFNFSGGFCRDERAGS
jgi:hypothetical protein